MAKRSVSAPDEARSIVASAFTASGIGSTSNAFFVGGVNAVVSGTFAGTVRIERSFDGGSAWLPVTSAIDGTVLAITTPTAIVLDEPESAVLYRWNCTAYTSGTINCRLSQG